MGFCPLVVLWLYAEFLHYSAASAASSHAHKGGNGLTDSDKDESASKLLLPATMVDHKGEPSPHNGSSKSGSRVGLLMKLMMMEPAACLSHRLTLRAMAEFGFIMVWFYLCDRTAVIPSAEKHYSRDLFMFLYLILVAVSWVYTMHKTTDQNILSGKSVGLLNRDQTEEWKGWMQVLFLIYHYFAAAELYNAIRLFIACYVWMTGFGNFSYYYMMWRLNFMVFIVCAVLSNSYMLYYICPMHTLFTLLVYIPLAIAPHLNTNTTAVLCKLAGCILFVIVVWELPGVFSVVWGPLSFLLGYKDPAHPELPPLHEWEFRSGLDRYVWIWGMLCALVHPAMESLMRKLEELEPKRREVLRYSLIGLCVVGWGGWGATFYTLPKLEYNKVHPFTSWIPISLYILLRNLSPTFRQYSMHLFAWLGKITLETYISQFHIWLRTAAPDAQPKLLLALIPDYPMLNFALATCIYIFVSLRLFNLTNTLKNSFIPLKDNAQLASNIAMGVAVVGVLYAVAKLILLL
eukprot:jgi/Chlat1/3329/Chrsp220S03395